MGLVRSTDQFFMCRRCNLIHYTPHYFTVPSINIMFLCLILFLSILNASFFIFLIPTYCNKHLHTRMRHPLEANPHQRSKVIVDSLLLRVLLNYYNLEKEIILSSYFIKNKIETKTIKLTSICR